MNRHIIPIPNLVTPAKAGVHHLPMKFMVPVMDSRLRGNDEIIFGEIGFERVQAV